MGRGQFSKSLPPFTGSAMTFAQDKAPPPRSGGWLSLLAIVGGVLLLPILLMIRTFLFQPFSIRSGSGMPTLLVADYIIFSQYSYGAVPYSLRLYWPRLFSVRLC